MSKPENERADDRLYREGLASQVHGQIRSAVMRGRFLPGEKLKLRDLATEYGVSLTPVREALARLVSEGALEQHDYRSVRVPLITSAILVEVGQLRCELEGRAAQHAAEIAEANEVKKLLDIHTSLERARDCADFTKMIGLNEQFHMMLCAISGGVVLIKLVESLWLKGGPVLRILSRLDRLHPASQHPHCDVIRALTCRDPGLARLAIQRDITVFTETAVRNLALMNPCLP